MTNGTVVPVWVVVVATSSGGLFGSYGWKAPSTDERYWYSYVGACSHFGSFEPFSQVHGLTCGPEIAGPPFAWSTSVIRAVRRPGADALRTFEPTRRPVSSPSKRPFGRRAKLLVTSWPRRRTVTFEALRPLVRP